MQQGTSEREFRRRVARTRAEFAELYGRDPEKALEILSDLIRCAVRLDRAFAFGLTDQPVFRRSP